MNGRPLIRLLAAIIAAGIFLLPPLIGQVTTADILGRITDSSGSVVPSAKVMLQNAGTQDVRTATPTAEGEFLFTLLQPGRYDLRIEAPGFKTFTATMINVVSGDRKRVDASLEVGQLTESVTVEATGTALQSETSTVSTVITTKAVQELPLNGRNFINLTINAPGAANNLAGVYCGLGPRGCR
jgi:hypothetical protein